MAKIRSQSAIASAWLHPVEAEPGPGLRVHLDDEGREIVVEAIGVRPDPAGLGLLEGEGEGVEHLVRAEPEEFVFPHLDVDAEMRLVAVADAAVGAVGGDDEVVAGPVVQVGARLLLEMEVHPELVAPAPAGCSAAASGRCR